MTRTSTHSRPRTTGAERLFVLGGLALAALYTAASLVLGSGVEHIGPLWLAAVAWTVLASVAHVLWLGLRHGDWSPFRRYRLPDSSGEDFDWATRTGRYAHHRIREQHELLMRDDDHLR